MEWRLKSNMLQDNGKNFLAAPCHSKNDRAINNDTYNRPYDVATCNSSPWCTKKFYLILFMRNMFEMFFEFFRQILMSLFFFLSWKTFTVALHKVIAAWHLEKKGCNRLLEFAFWKRLNKAFQGFISLKIAQSTVCLFSSGFVCTGFIRPHLIRQGQGPGLGSWWTFIEFRMLWTLMFFAQ